MKKKLSPSEKLKRNGFLSSGNGTITVKKDSKLHEFLRHSPYNASNEEQAPAFKELKNPGKSEEEMPSDNSSLLP